MLRAAPTMRAAVRSAAVAAKGSLRAAPLRCIACTPARSYNHEYAKDPMRAPHGIAHSKAPIELADELPIVVTTEDVAKCDGGGGALGHPTEFIKNNKGYPNECKYCGARFVQPEFAAKYIPGFDQLAWVKEHAHGHH